MPVRGGYVFSAGKKMSERSELFFPEEKTYPPRKPAPTPWPAQNHVWVSGTKKGSPWGALVRTLM